PVAPTVPAVPVGEQDFGELIAESGIAKIYKTSTGKVVYSVPVPRPTGPERQLLDTIKEAATRLITVTPEEIADPNERRAFFKKRVLEIIEASPELGVAPTKIDFYADTIVREMIGYGSLDLLLGDDQLEEIMVIGPHKPVYVFHRKHEMIATNVVFGRDDDIRAIVDRVARDVGRRIDVKDPLLDARLPDGSRVNATIPPISLEGSTITIRKFREDPYTVVDLIKFGTLNADLAAFLWIAAEGLKAKPANILVSGGTGSGKTTTLNTLAAFIPRTERILTMEDTAEIKIPVEHWIRFETRPPGIEGTGEVTMDTLVKNSLRMRPDRIVVGEVRGGEASTLFTAMNTGHDGSFGTVHANDSRETLVRLKSPPMNVPELMLAALNLIIVQKRIHDRRKGTIRRVTEVAEVTGVLEGNPQIIYLYEWDAATDTIKPTGVPSKFLNELSKYTGLSHTEIQAEINRRKDFLEQMVEQEVTGITTVCDKIHEFVG
ncbi:CpaF family protein, partial [archaeon]